MRIPLLAWLLQGIPESIGLASVAISLSFGQFRWRLIFIIGLIHAILMYIIRLLPFTFWAHMPILAIAFAVQLSLIGKIKTRKAFVYSIISFLILFLSETLLIAVWCWLGKYSINKLANNTTVRIVAGFPQVIILFLTAFVINKRKIWRKAMKRQEKFEK